MGAAKTGFKPVPRVGSNARLGEDGGSGAQLILGFAIKVSLLGAVVFALVNYDLPVHVRNFVYGAPPETGCCSCELSLQRPCQIGSQGMLLFLSAPSAPPQVMQAVTALHSVSAWTRMLTPCHV